MMFALTNMSEVALVLSMLVEVADGIGNGECLGLLDTSQQAHPLLGMEVLIKKAVKVLRTQQQQQHSAGATDQCMYEEAPE